MADIDVRSFSCEKCGAAPGQPCVTVRAFHGQTGCYRGQGVAAEHVHQSRIVKLVAARRAAREGTPLTMNPERGEQNRTQSIDWDPLGEATRERPEIKMTGAQLMDLVEERDEAKRELVAVRSALRNLVEAWDSEEVQADFASMASMAHVHGWRTNGATIQPQLKAARALLDGLSETPEAQ